MKKLYEAPSMELVLLSTQDIVTASQNDDIQDDFFRNVSTSWFE